MKKKVLTVLLLIGLISTIMTGCNEADRVSTNLSKEADNFNVVRQLTVINCITGDTLFQMSVSMSITADTSDNQPEGIVEEGGT